MTRHNQHSGLGQSVHGRLLSRESNPNLALNGIRSLYSDRDWISNLDIVNELAGHQGCVNALSWSKSGALLASGSDDTNLIIHRYQPEFGTKPFTLATCLSTGHRANIFSVKFMPHSNDRTLISCAGDHEVRVFDLEYSGAASQSSDASSVAGARSQAGQRNISGLYQGVTYLSDGSTNARIYRSHSDRVKRIVTESSPHFFLTCSEDGEVRQFDLRLPSSAYPRGTPGRSVAWSSVKFPTGNAPPPLISYKKYQLDLNSISCSASQPHYIVLGGAHLHCFLHDRRMLGRDMLDERGSKTDSDMGTATRCVRRFAPDGKTVMHPRRPGHVTACKISDKNPNEMIASWSGDKIYAFNLIQPYEAEVEETSQSRKSKESKDRKRKRSTPGSREEDVVIRMRYENGQTEDFPVAQSVSQKFINQAKDSVLTPAQRRSAQIAKSVVKIRELLFSMDHGSDLTTLKPILSNVLGLTTTYIQEMDDVIRSWGYPVDPDAATIAFQTTLRKNRDKARRFVQGCGTLARVLGGRLQTAGSSPLVMLFDKIDSSELEHPERDPAQLFRHHFLRAILLWLEGGRNRLANLFSQQAVRRFAMGQAMTLQEENLELVSISAFLAGLVGRIEEKHIVSVDNSVFETDDRRIVFAREADALSAFTEAIKIPFGGKTDIAGRASQSKESAMKFWGLKVCRGLLLNAAEGVNFAFMDRAFGGLGLPSEQQERSQEDLIPEVEEHGAIASFESDPSEESPVPTSDVDASEEDVPDGPLINIEDILEGEEIAFDEDKEDDSDDVEDVDFDDEDEEDEEQIDEEGDADEDDTMDSGIFFRGSAARNTMRAQVNKDIPCNTHIRSYEGHCNVKTVKDVNYFGLDDEYVVSGCDSGHLFIWDTKTKKLLNILKGDEEVVNVVQGHPYEPTLAVSGIDHTIKIFSPDTRAQRDARKGINIGTKPSQGSGTSSIRFRNRAAAVPEQAASRATNFPQDCTSENMSDDDSTVVGGLASRRRMHNSYEIMNQNEVDRAGGNREAFITRDMLSQIALMMAQRRGQLPRTTTGEEDENDDDDDDDDDDDEARAMIGAELGDRCANM